MAWTQWQTVEGEGLEFEQILFEKKHHEELGGGVARVTINLPDKYNAMTVSTVDEMFRAFYDANHDKTIGVIIVAGAGKHFGVGGDVEWERWGLREAFYNRYPHNRLIRASRQPVMAVVQGYCLGGHNHMAYCCDFTIAADTAVFGQAGPKVSSPADGFFVPYLTKVVGAKKAREMWMLCRRYTAEQALEMGLVNKVVPLNDMEVEVEQCDPGGDGASERMGEADAHGRLALSGGRAHDADAGGPVGGHEHPDLRSEDAKVLAHLRT